MKSIFIDTPLFIKIFASAFTCLAGLATGAFYYVGNKIQTSYKADLLKVHKSKEIVNAQRKQLAELRRKTIA
ncbi:hypothetical protein OVS_00370 [Mycoplasma ovis str. Michigan]|uniref:Uncharacterized protein n=1 Tax=Mycoplasma ovis str. Michigan TaxID=1415773 RepID=A0ABM5P093_9MOLU|nr:hypothetical protein [Mycoplasma ovis]AHC39804.1 hypothetical protein OVS_00370 [Mycoplasma ovis str. Michigan]